MKFSNHIYTDNRRVFMDNRNQDLQNTQFEMVAIGDSITEGLNLNRFEAVDYSWLNSGISGDISTILKTRIENDCLAFKPEIVSLMIGINDVRNFFNKMDYIYQVANEEQLRATIVANTLEIVEQLIANHIEVVYTQILPVNELEKNNGYINQFIDQLNNEISTKLDDQVLIIEAAQFKNQVNNLDLNLTYDGLHLNELGYQKWCKALNQKIRTIRGAK